MIGNITHPKILYLTFIISLALNKNYVEIGNGPVLWLLDDNFLKIQFEFKFKYKRYR